MSKHTPGPWVAVIGDDERLRSGNQRRYFPHVLMPGIFQGRLVINEGGGPMEEHDANARLIAAAPELLEALIDCREALRQAGAVGELSVVDAAIAKAKAKGEQA